MNPLVGLGQAWRWSVRKILGLWVRATIKPEDAWRPLEKGGCPFVKA